MAFRVAARTILELGAELISSDATALYELIKNAYDARSKRATIAITTVFKYSHLRDTLKRIEQAQKTVATQGADADVLADRILKDVLSKIDESAPEHMRRRESARRAGRPRRDGHVAERQHECVGLDAGKADIQVSGQTLVEGTIDGQFGYRVA